MEKTTISAKIQLKLAIIVLIAMTVSTILILLFNTSINKKNYENIIITTLEDVEKDIEDTSNINMLAQTLKIKEKVKNKFKTNNMSNVQEMNDYLKTVAKEENLDEATIVNKENIIIYSSVEEYVGFDMDATEDTREFDTLNHGATEVIQPMRENAYKGEGDFDEYNKYAGVPIENVGYLQVAINSKSFQTQIDEKVIYIAENRHIGQTGYVVISNAKDIVISNANGEDNIGLDELGLKFDKNNLSLKSYTSTINREINMCITKLVEGYYITGVVPMVEVQSFRNRAAASNLIVETIIFGLLFLFINASIRDDIVNKIRNINKNLHKIIEGELNTTVDEYSTKEFDELSTDINSAVKTLKDYSEKEKENIKKELEFAKNIQMSALPKVNTLTSHHSDFKLYATINTAKEVGGDFYDFYMLDDNHLVILIADVSGKGVPAAMFMMTCKTMIKNHIESGLSLEGTSNK